MTSRGCALTATAAMLATGMAIGQSVAADADYCRDFTPSIAYLRMTLPNELQGQRLTSLLDGSDDDSDAMKVARANAGPRVAFSAAAVKFAAISSFIEQLPIAVLGQQDPFLKSLHVRSLEASVRDGMGFGPRGSRLAEPGSELPQFDDVPLEVTDTDGTSAFADASGKIRIERGLVDRMVANAVDRIYGGIDGYKLHLREVLALTDSPTGLIAGPAAATDVGLYVDPTGFADDITSFPIGAVISTATAEYNAANPFVNTKAFANEIVGEFVFIGAHEVGHVRNGHKKVSGMACDQFLMQEREADRYAAGVLAAFQFNMEPSADASLIDWGSFFAFYNDSGFTTDDAASNCQYDSPDTRQKGVQQAYESTWSELATKTLSAPDYATPNPTASICLDGADRWRKPVE